MSKIDENQIRRHLKILSQVEPTSEATDRAMEKVRDSLSDKKKRRESTSLWQFSKRPIAKLVAAAVLLIAIGYAVGRLTTPQRDMEQLQSALETSLRASLTKEMDRRWQTAFTANCVQLKDDFQQQVRRDLTDFAVQILAASNTRMEQHLTTLVEKIETARARDRRQTAAAFEKLDFDKSQLGKGLLALATQTSNLHEIKQD
jgi:hypothetical protein